jgi:hypothetical protein
VLFRVQHAAYEYDITGTASRSGFTSQIAVGFLLRPSVDPEICASRMHGAKLGGANRVCGADTS